MTLTAFCKDEIGCELDGGLILNKEPISFNQAKLMSNAFVLRWRYRICKYCGDSFDIEDNGFAYNCGCYQ